MIGIASAWWLILFMPLALPVQRPIGVSTVEVLATLPVSSEEECRTLENQARGSAGPMRFWACVRDERFAPMSDPQYIIPTNCTVLPRVFHLAQVEINDGLKDLNLACLLPTKSERNVRVNMSITTIEGALARLKAEVEK